MPRFTRTLPLPILLGLGVLAPWPTWAQDQDAAMWHEVGGVPRTVTLGSYRLEVEERVVEDADMQRFIPAIVPSPQAEAAAWLYRMLNGARVRYDSFLGAERISFERSLSFRLGTEQLEPNEVDGVIGQLYDRNHNGRLSARELSRGNATMAQLFSARVRSTVEPGRGFQPVPGLEDATAFADAWLDHEAVLAAIDPWYCPECAGVPHQDKLAALVGFLQEYAPPLDGAHTTLFVPGLNQIFVTVDMHPGRHSTLRLDAADGRTYWDMGHLPHGDSTLDGRLDLVTSAEDFPGASYNTIAQRWERYDPGPGNQWMYEVLVDLAHAHLPRRLQVAVAMDLEPEFEVPLWFRDELSARLSARTPAMPLSFDVGGDLPPAASFN